ncbi:hypothetical protein L7F22_031298 [Adiantum nelumboides]|nr:hypothetical protein [Adiantum nelumboides]
MQEAICSSNLLNLLQACCRKKDLIRGRQVYSIMAQNNFESTALLADYFIRLLATRGYVEDADKAFSYVSNPSVYTWTAMISAHASLGHTFTAIDLHFKMQQCGTQPDRVMFLCVLKACSCQGALHFGRLIHHQVFDSGIMLDVVIGNTLVDMYAKCGNLDEARSLFDKLPSRTLVSWSALIAGYAEHGSGDLAYEFFFRMQEEGFNPCRGLFLCILKVCAAMEDSKKCMVTHDQTIVHGFECDILVGSSLVDVYAKCDCLKEAHKVFKLLPNPNVVSWGALINGYAQHGQGYLALELFEKIQREGFKPDAYLYSCMIKLCASMGALEQGKLLHKFFAKSGLRLDTVVGNALIDMYCKCGILVMAHKVFNELPIKDVASWGALIAGYAAYGVYKQAVKLLEGMRKQGISPDSGVFLNILAACSHSGLLEDGRHHFKAMVANHGITPTIEHYNCIIDLFSRTGRLNEATDLLHTISAKPDVIGRRSLLVGANSFKHVEIKDA